MGANGTNGHATLFGEREQPEPLTEFAERIDQMARALIMEVGKFRARLEAETKSAIHVKAIARTASPGDVRAAKAHPVKAVMSHFDTAHQRKFDGAAATFTTPQDPSLIKRLIETHGEEKVRELIDQFFETNDDWLARTGYTVGNFQKRVAGLISQSLTPVRALGNTTRTVDNGRHADAAADMIQRAYGER